MLHADADAFFASVEQLDHPELVGVPVLVGGAGPRGVVASASREAKRLGASSAMPMWRGRQLCGRSVVVVSPRFDRYRELSEQMLAVFEQHADTVEAISVDEAYLQVPHDAEAATVAGFVRREVRRRLGITVSVGGGTTKVVAKMLSAWVKTERGPGTQAVLDPSEELDWLATQPVRALPGCGPVTAATLAELGVATIADLRRQSASTLVRRLGKAAATNLLSLAHNDDPRPVAPPAARKQVSQEHTFPQDLPDLPAIAEAVARTAREVAATLADKGVGARTFTVKLRTGDFTDVSRSHTLPAPTGDVTRITELTAQLAEDAHLAAGGGGVRLVGVAAANLSSADQPTLDLDLDRS